MRLRRFILFVIFLGVAGGYQQPGLITASTKTAGLRSVSPSGGTSGIDKINHVIWIIQENHSFDNYFGTFPGADGIPPSTCLPKLPGSKGCVASFHMPEGAPPCDLDHGWVAAHAAYDNGKMDGFVWAEGTSYTMGYYDERDIPNYWRYARRFTLCDRFFSSYNGPSLPNHLYTVAAQSGGLVTNPANLREVEDAEDDPDGFSFASMVDLFERAKVSWKYYVEAEPPPADPQQLARYHNPNIWYPDPKKFSLWNPLPGFKAIRDKTGVVPWAETNS
jgi:phospholipase C